MSDNEAMCACLHVKYSPVDNGDGTVSERWQCELCGGVFRRVATKQQCAEQGCDEIATVEKAPGVRVCGVHGMRTESLDPGELPQPVPFSPEGWEVSNG
jgi:hypothetical protein